MELKLHPHFIKSLARMKPFVGMPPEELDKKVQLALAVANSLPGEHSPEELLQTFMQELIGVEVSKIMEKAKRLSPEEAAVIDAEIEAEEEDLPRH